jgi:hypothetical protein
LRAARAGFEIRPLGLPRFQSINPALEASLCLLMKLSRFLEADGRVLPSASVFA